MAIMVRAAALGRLRGARVGMTFGAIWALYSIVALPTAAKIAGGIAILALWLLAMREARRLGRAAKAFPRAGEAGPGGRRRTLGFVVIVVGEIALMNLAVWLLAAPALHVYRIAAIALVVGLHFAPLAILFRLPAFWGTAIAMTALAVLAAVAIRLALLSPAIVDAVLAFGNALILWITAASGFADVRAAIPTSQRLAVQQSRRREPPAL